jgi:hypothetical protein
LELLRLALSIKTGTVTASVILRKRIFEFGKRAQLVKSTIDTGIAEY